MNALIAKYEQPAATVPAVASAAADTAKLKTGKQVVVADQAK